MDMFFLAGLMSLPHRSSRRPAPCASSSPMAIFRSSESVEFSPSQLAVEPPLDCAVSNACCDISIMESLPRSSCLLHMDGDLLSISFQTGYKLRQAIGDVFSLKGFF